MALGEPSAAAGSRSRRFVGPPLADGFAELIGPEPARASSWSPTATRYKTASLERTTGVPTGWSACSRPSARTLPLPPVATSKPLAYSHRRSATTSA